MRFQGYTALHDGDGVLHVESSAFVSIDRGNPAISLDCSDRPSLTRQEFKAECDINTIMARYETTGVISHIGKTTPQYVDVTGMPPDFASALAILADAEAAFSQLPAKVRREFDNDPVKFVEFAQDPANVDRMREWGLAEPLPPPAPVQKVEVVNPPQDAPKSV